MARGGQRTAKPGSMLPNRSDMRTTQPIKTAPGQPYGVAGAQAAAQAQVPLANGGAAPAPTQTPTAPPPAPGDFGSLFDPSTRPGEPVTHGAASGPGAGPEALQPAPGGLDINSASTMLSTLAQVSGSPELAVLAKHAASMGQ